MPAEKTDPHNGNRALNLLTGVVVILVAIGMAGVSILQNQRVSRIADRADDRAACTTDVLSDLLRAVNERTSYTEELATANIDQLQAFAALVEASLRRPPPDRQESRHIVTDYRDALDAYLDLAAQAKAQRKEYPYPTVAAIRACAE